MYEFRKTIKLFFLGISGLGVGFSNSALAQTFNYADLESLIQKNQVQSIDQLLPLLPETYRKHYTFVYESNSAQAKNTLTTFPRVILFGEDSKFLMAFTKNPKTAPVTPGEDSLETIDFDQATSRFVFRRLVFETGKDPLNPPPIKNPKTCLGCHGSDPRPNWDAYNIWPGVFGSLSRRGCDVIVPGKNEYKYYAEFLAENRNKDRYQFLPREMKSDCAPEGTVNFSNAAESEPNARLTEQIDKLNAARIRRMAKESPLFSKFQYVLAALDQYCQIWLPQRPFFPERDNQTYGESAYDRMHEQVTKQSSQEFLDLKERFLKNNSALNGSDPKLNKVYSPIEFNAKGSGFALSRPIALTKLIASWLGLPLHRLSMGFLTDESFMTSNVQLSATAFEPAADDQWFVPEGGLNQSCEELAEKSMKEFDP